MCNKHATWNSNRLSGWPRLEHAIYTSPSSISGYILYAILYNALLEKRHTAGVTHSRDCK